MGVNTIKPIYRCVSSSALFSGLALLFSLAHVQSAFAGNDFVDDVMSPEEIREYIEVNYRGDIDPNALNKMEHPVHYDEDNEPGVTIDLIHTNDLHSHYRPCQSPRGELGGISRIKTAIDGIRKQNPNTVLVDGGDWSEGTIYYTQGAGAETLKLMHHLGYDVAVVGNHDWLNGPDKLLEAIGLAHPWVGPYEGQLALVSANLDPRRYTRRAEFESKILPYVVKNVGGVKIAFIGLSTFEKIYDQFFAPIKIFSPLDITHRLARELKESKEADVVVVISHNGIFANKALIKYAPDIDLVVGAHDHRQLNEPIEVNRFFLWGKGRVWIVEAGSWGQYLGDVKLKYTKSGKLLLLDSHLIQIDASLKKDPEIEQHVAQLEDRILNSMGPDYTDIFTQTAAHSELPLVREGVNNIGELVTDAYLMIAPQAHFAIESFRYIPDGINQGDIRKVDLFDTVPQIFNPDTKKTWTIKTVEMTGATVKWFLQIAFFTHKLGQVGGFNFSGIEFEFNPWFQMAMPNTYNNYLHRFFNGIQHLFTGPTISGINEILIQGKPLELRKVYTVAMGEGMIISLNYLNSLFPGILPYQNKQDTGVETWRALDQYISARMAMAPYRIPRISERNFQFGNRHRARAPHLALFDYKINWDSMKETGDGHLQGKIKVPVHNYGLTASVEGSKSNGARARLLVNKNGTNYSKDPIYMEIGAAIPLPSIEPGKAFELEWDVTIPKISNRYSVTAILEEINDEAYNYNREATSWKSN